LQQGNRRSIRRLLIDLIDGNYGCDGPYLKVREPRFSGQDCSCLEALSLVCSPPFGIHSSIHLTEPTQHGSALTLIGGSLSFGGFLEVLPFILMLAGGMLALKEKVEVTPKTG
jgi:hypothetical protein